MTDIENIFPFQNWNNVKKEITIDILKYCAKMSWPWKKSFKEKYALYTYMYYLYDYSDLLALFSGGVTKNVVKILTFMWPIS